MALPNDVKGQFVRIELPGEKRTLSLAEVMVVEKEGNRRRLSFCLDGSCDGFRNSAPFELRHALRQSYDTP